MMTFDYWVRTTPGRSSRSNAGFRGFAVLIPALFLTALAAHGQTVESLARAYREKPTPAGRSALLRFAAAHKKEESATLALFVVGLTDQEHHDDADAMGNLKAVEGKLPVLADYAAFALAQAEYSQNDYAAALRDVEKVWANTPPSPFAIRAVMLAAHAHLDRGAPAEAVRLLRQHSEELPQPAGDMLLAQSLEADGKTLDAAGAWQRIFVLYPTSPEAKQAETGLERMRKALGARYPPILSGALLTRTLKLIDAHEYRWARRELESLIGQTAGAERDTAKVRLGVVSCRSNEVQSARTYLKGLHVSGEADAERLYYVAFCARRLAIDSDVDESLSELAKKYPQSSWRLKALVMAADRLLVQNQPQTYEPLYRACYESFPNEADASYCHWKVAWSTYLRQRGEAAGLFREHLKRFPSSEKAGAAMYYLGRLAEGTKDYSSARTYYQEIADNYPNYYYAVLARERLRDANVLRAIRSPVVADFLNQITFPPRSHKLEFDPTPGTKARIARSRLLTSLGFADTAADELRFGAKTDEQSHILAMEMAKNASQQGEPDRAIRAIKTLAPGYLFMPVESAPPAFWRLAFPLPYRADLERNCKEHSLDPFLVAALIRQESEFNPKAISRAKAYGLTQVLPSTGRQLSRQLGMRRFSTSMLVNPEVNLKLGTFYLRTLYDQLGSKWEATLASYNAGKSRVVNWLTWADYREPAEFVESIPFTETRNYVQYVVRNADLYRRFYATAAIEDAPVKKTTPAPAAKKSARVLNRSGERSSGAR